MKIRLLRMVAGRVININEQIQDIHITLPSECSFPAALQVDDVTSSRIKHDLVTRISDVGYREEGLRDRGVLPLQSGSLALVR
eukprot:10684555-Heterocapsa_arctica.AAC.1